MNDGREINFIKNSGLFFLKVMYNNVVNPFVFYETKQRIKGDVNLWHKRLGHLNRNDVGGAGEMKDDCETCAMEKQASQPVPKKAEHKAKKALELVYRVSQEKVLRFD